jgi:RNA-directed DNA polymerase
VLHGWKEAVGEHLSGLRLALNWRRSVVYPTATGIPFLGYRIFQNHRRLLAANVRTARQRLRHNRAAYLAGDITLAKFRESLQAWIAHASHADTWQLRRRMLSDIVL